jgi:hypothetical protein
MDKDINLVVEEFRQNLVATVNNSGLPASIIYYVLTDVYNEINSQYKAYLRDAQQKLMMEQAESATLQDNKDEEA